VLHYSLLQVLHKIKFGHIYLSKPSITEPDGKTLILFPKDARLRNLTYSAALYIDITRTTISFGPDGEEQVETQEYPKTHIGKVR
jgi:DNA-directed RNA polymerase II subunit RPB2